MINHSKTRVAIIFFSSYLTMHAALEKSALNLPSVPFFTVAISLFL